MLEFSFLDLGIETEMHNSVVHTKTRQHRHPPPCKIRPSTMPDSADDTRRFLETDDDYPEPSVGQCTLASASGRRVASWRARNAVRPVWRHEAQHGRDGAIANSFWLLKQEPSPQESMRVRGLSIWRLFCLKVWKRTVVSVLVFRVQDALVWVSSCIENYSNLIEMTVRLCFMVADCILLKRPLK